MRQQDRTVQEMQTTLSPGDVLAAAKRFFTRRNAIYSTFIEKEGPNYASFRGQGGEELIIGVVTQDGFTRVTGSTYMFDQQIAMFFATLAAGNVSVATMAGEAMS